jgi:L,D-transpeptidase YcbB
MRCLPSIARIDRQILLGLTILVVAACGKGDGDQSSTKRPTRVRHVSRGAVVTTWSPPTLSAVAGVPIADVRTSIATRLKGARPAATLDEDQWRHTRTLYKRFGGGPLFLDDKGPDEKRARSLLRALVDADKDALRLDAYPLVELSKVLAGLKQGPATAEQLAEADVLLTSAFVALGEDLLTGQINPRRVSQDWNIDPKEEEVDSALVFSFGEQALDQGIARMRPEDPSYEELRKALVRYREIDAKGGWPTVPKGRALKPGEPEKIERLEALKARLSAEGLLAAAAPAAASTVPKQNAIGGDSADSAQKSRPAKIRPPGPGEAVYDSALAGAVAVYQARHAIVVDSILGDETVSSMNLPASYRLAQIASNLERHRWMPRALGERYIVVNVPAFHLEAWDGEQQALDMKVIVGEEYEDKKTAVFSDTMTTVVFRPYWNITDDIAAKETWPKINADPGYMAANDLETYRDGNVTRLRQKPGDKNSLGLVKFLFPNSFNIYLHDTPEHGLFDKDVRAFSHGCIRLEKPAELAQWVLGLTPDSVERAMQSQPNDKHVKIPRPLPVYITYFTTYTQDGELRFGNDLYDRDAAMVKVMQAEAGQKPETVQAVRELREAVK